MKQARLVVIGVLCLIPMSSVAQMADTVEVLIHGDRFDNVASEELSNRLIQESGETVAGRALVQNLGPGLLKTLRLQGLATRHTAIIWEGHNLQSALNGTYDLNLLPPSDGVLSNQSFSHLRGGVGLGGGLLIQNKITDRYVSISGDNTRNLKLDLKHSIDKKGSLHALQFQLVRDENRFRYIRSGEIVKRNHADLYGVNVKSDHLFNINRIPVKFSTWYQDYNRVVGPSKTSVYNGAIQEDRNLRLSLKIGNQESMLVTMAYLREYIGYKEGSIDSKGSTHAVIGGAQWKLKSHHLISIYNRLDVSDANFYDKTYYRNLLDLAYTFKKEITELGRVEGHFLQSIVNDELGPWSGMASVERKLWTGFNIRAEVDKSYQLPTFNDLYWWDGGNPDLKTESAYGYGLIAGYSDNRLESKVIFRQKYIGNWINWLPLDGNRFTPINHRSVRATTLSWRCNYALSNHVRISGAIHNTRTVILEDDRFKNLEGKQAIYVPKLRSKLGVLYNPSSWSLYIEGNFRSKLYSTSDNTSSLPARYIQNASVSKKLLLNNNEYIFSLGIHNVFNVDYEEVAFYPMPLRFFKFNFKINY